MTRSLAVAISLSLLFAVNMALFAAICLGGFLVGRFLGRKIAAFEADE